MFRLLKADGTYVCSERTGEPFKYSSYQLADAACRALRKQHGPLKMQRVNL